MPAACAKSIGFAVPNQEIDFKLCVGECGYRVEKTIARIDHGGCCLQARFPVLNIQLKALCRRLSKAQCVGGFVQGKGKFITIHISPRCLGSRPGPLKAMDVLDELSKNGG